MDGILVKGGDRSLEFFDKFKAGVSDAGNKAKILVEVNKLKLQNSGKKSDINEQLLEIGKVVYGVAEAGQWPPTGRASKAMWPKSKS